MPRLLLDKGLLGLLRVQSPLLLGLLAIANQFLETVLRLPRGVYRLLQVREHIVPNLVVVLPSGPCLCLGLSRLNGIVGRERCQAPTLGLVPALFPSFAIVRAMLLP